MWGGGGGGGDEGGMGEMGGGGELYTGETPSEGPSWWETTLLFNLQPLFSITSITLNEC